MSIYHKEKFTSQHTIVDLVNYDFNILPILSRFSIPLGFGNKTIKEVCEVTGLSTDLFLLIVNFIFFGSIDMASVTTEGAEPLVEFLHNSHRYFLEYKFPHIRKNLTEALDKLHTDINPAILGFFDKYVEHVCEHFRNEEDVLFPYIRALYDGETMGEYNISVFHRHHEKIDQTLSDLKNVILKYYTTSTPNLMYDALVDIYNCEADLRTHSDIENHILVPMISDMEQQIRTTNKRERK